MTVQSPSSSVLDLLDCPATSFLRSFHAFLSMTEFDWDYGGKGEVRAGKRDFLQSKISSALITKNLLILYTRFFTNRFRFYRVYDRLRVGGDRKKS